MAQEKSKLTISSAFLETIRKIKESRTPAIEMTPERIKLVQDVENGVEPERKTTEIVTRRITNQHDFELDVQARYQAFVIEQ